MSEISHNPYRVLGVERTADERAIKRAYFALLREFPPDKHPERFKEIRAAYELLSDAEARKRFDAADRGYDEYPPEIAGRLRLVDEMAVHAPPGHSRAALEQLVFEHPEVDLARERLADVAMTEGDFASALAQWEVLTSRHPDSATFAFARGVTLGRLGRACDAEAALREAVRLAPAESACRRSLAKVLVDAGRIADALAELDALIAMDGVAPAARLGAELQRARMLVRSARADEAFVALDSIQSRLAEGRDREMAELVASAIGAIAAARVATRISSAWSLPAALLRAQLDATDDESVSTLRDSHRAWVGSLRGASKAPPGGSLGDATTLQQMALRDPSAAALRAAQTPVEALLWLHPPIVVLLAAELTRAADEARARWLLAVTDVAPVPPWDLVDYVATGRSTAALRRLDPELRAALDLGRARVLAARGVESPDLRDAVVRGDPLHGPVRIALETWPAPRPGPNERMAVLE